MKTNEFIKILQQADPNNQCDVCVGNYPVYWVEKQYYYYDGRQEFVERLDGYPVRGGYPSGTMKLKIHYDTLEDALMDNPDMQLDLSGITHEGKVHPRYQENIEQWILAGRQFQDWRKKLEDAHKSETGAPLFSDPPNFKTRLGEWLRRLGVID